MSKFAELTEQEIQNLLEKCHIEDDSVGQFDVKPGDTIYACGDFHGDFEACLVCLRDLCQVLKVKQEKYGWSGKENTYVVILGDMVDRKRPNQYQDNKDRDLGVGEIEDEELKIIRLLSILDSQARYYNSRVLKCYGNHEVMNMSNIFSYVSGLTSKEDKEQRKKEFAPGGQYRNALQACGIYGVVKLGDWIFTHGGISKELLETLGQSFSKDFIENTNKIGTRMAQQAKLKATAEERQIYHPTINDKNKQLSILWNREYGDLAHNHDTDHSVSICKRAKETMELLGYDPVKTRFVVAHTHQYFRQYIRDRGYILYGNDPIVEQDRVIYSGNGRIQHPQDYCGTSINYTCPIPNEDGQIWRIDVAMSRAFDIKDLKIANGKTYKELVADESNKLDFQKAIRLRRPQVLQINVEEHKTSPFVIMSRYDLPRSWVPSDWLKIKTDDEKRI